MEKLKFEIVINADPSHVFKVMLEKPTYEEWTAVFSPTSTFEGSWIEGSKILFVGEDEQGQKGGMISKIDKIIPNEFVSILHLGVFKNGEEDLDSPEVKEWAGAHENYIFVNQGKQTLLKVELDSNEEFASYFDGIWPKALSKLKEICEK